jgi:hypothetical protein
MRGAGHKSEDAKGNSRARADKEPGRPQTAAALLDAGRLLHHLHDESRS